MRAGELHGATCKPQNAMNVVRPKNTLNNQKRALIILNLEYFPSDISLVCDVRARTHA